ncbi:MAG: Rpn family recombination-promoting nuclease/putative transposase [Phaeodactylibacter sp.]|nr:Rpn family recombination-promoting nuclease/putative transposase [Phaeodactylibacter sp.]
MKTKVTKDKLWKGIIEDCFEDFFRFFYPEWVDKIDFGRKVEFLDKELEQLMPESVDNPRYADKLVKLFTKEGKEHWILIHIEVQGYRDKHFAERMFIYFYRIFDKHRRPINAIAILTDSSPGFHPRSFEYSFMNTRLAYDFDTYKLLEKKQADFYLQSDNPFSIVLETAWGSLKAKKGIELLELKKKVAKRLFQSGLTRKKVESILNFIRFYVKFSRREKENAFQFEKFISEIAQNKRTMATGVTERVIEALKEEAIEKGMKQGMKQGIEKGIKESIARLLKKGILPEQVCDLLDVSPEMVAEVQQQLMKAGEEEE